MKTTITDVAKQAGVSMKTVSRVLNNEPNVAKATRDRVMSVAEQLQYRPNLAARGLASSRSYLIALLDDNPSASYTMDMQKGAIEACRKAGYHLLLEPLSLTQVEKPEVAGLITRLGVDGVILTPPLSDSLPLRETLKLLGMPHVVVAPRHAAESHAIRMDDEDAAFQMTNLLIDQGHTAIGFILGPEQHGASDERRAGYERAFRQAMLDLDESLIVPGDFTFRSGVAAAETLLSNHDSRPTAIFASNDDMAAGVVNVANRLGVCVPDDLSVCGFDDSPLARIIWPKLTTVAQPIRQMGRKAAELLIDRSAETESSVHTLDFEIITRQSTRP